MADALAVCRFGDACEGLLKRIFWASKTTRQDRPPSLRGQAAASLPRSLSLAHTKLQCAVALTRGDCK